ncbi:hydantoinase/oxoprolinase family protein [Conexibacter arvalis]|uniref:N-methylhydantoinase A n=1 Tax=Conexibacter arvalis TaxID=912552 RepID=A0A840IJM3_9ACTN|nr:hydantoinase/oxoprolinase family protein [Conexibacter arvalis]MBB4664363.1 N-methylhydantoinase A [Conexibacter arvalis]
MTALRRIGVDTGGTFTDCVLIDYETNDIVVAKVPSRPRAPHEAIMHGIGELAVPADAGDGAAHRVESVTHGTTIATNAVITGDFARIGFITTEGFRDVLEIGTQMRPKLYDLHQSPRAPMVARRLRAEVSERISATGEVIAPLDRDEVEAVARRLLDEQVEAIAIGCMFSFANAEHEERIQEIVEAIAPGLYVGRSSRISQEPREYPRFATAAVNAALAPRIDAYIRGLEERLAEHAPGTRLYVMQSNGGIGTAERSVGEHVHRLILSGPAAGVMGGARAAAECGFDDCITFDVGGTSADVGVVTGGRPRTGIEMELPNGVPCKLPHIEVEAIGAGGGSIAWVDLGGALNVGPQSAGADPGPACYGRSGTEPTVTDAHLLLGRLSPRGLVDGGLELDVERAREALAALAGKLGIDTDAAALGVLALLEQNMAGAIRRAAARHGDDLRDFVLVAGGGAGPLHAVSVMRSLGMAGAVIPPHPGLLSALGLLAAHLRHDRVTPLLGLTGTLSDDAIEDAFAALEGEAALALAEDGVAAEDRRFERLLDLRYLGQEYTLRVPTAAGESQAEVVARFHELHERTFGHAAPKEQTELVAARLVAIGVRAAPLIEQALPREPGAPYDRRRVTFDAASGPVEAAIYQRERLAAEQRVDGPAVIEQLDSTTLIPVGCHAVVHPSGSLVVTVSEER